MPAREDKRTQRWQLRLHLIDGAFEKGNIFFSKGWYFHLRVAGLSGQRRADGEQPVLNLEQGVSPARVYLLIAKQRNGPTGDVNLTFLKTFTRFENAAKISADDVPAE